MTSPAQFWKNRALQASHLLNNAIEAKNPPTSLGLIFHLAALRDDRTTRAALCEGDYETATLLFNRAKEHYATATVWISPENKQHLKRIQGQSQRLESTYTMEKPQAPPATER